MSSNKKSRWVNNEKQIVSLLAKYRIPATRKLNRNMNYCISDFDCEIVGHPEYKLDGKYCARGWRSSTVLLEVEDKYCKMPGDFALIFTKAYREVGQRVCMDDELAAMLLSYWLGFATKEELMEIYLGGKKSG